MFYKSDDAVPISMSLGANSDLMAHRRGLNGKVSLGLPLYVAK
jgi:hypothetical protein